MVSQRWLINIVEHLRRLFGGNPPRVQAAALPWRREPGRIEVLLITSRGTGRWVLPKGWPEGNETLAETAAREAWEEAGVKGTVARTELGRYFYEKQTGTGLRWRCEVAVFPLEVKREAKRWPEMKQRTHRWVSLKEAGLMVDEPDLKELLATFESNSRKIAA